MSNNNKGDKSKIDKIREDLEKKLAALEKAKLNTDESETTSEDNENVNSIKDEAVVSEEKVETEDIVEEEEVGEVEKSSFLDQISSIENETKSSDNDIVSANDEEDVDDNDETIFEISDEIEVIPEEESTSEEKEEKIIPPTITPKEEKIDFNQIEKQQNQDVINSSEEDINNESIDETEDDEIEEEDEKSSKTNFLIYGLVGLLLLVVGYFTLDYLKGKDKLNSDITNKKIDELENRRYQDSIKLLEAERRLAEFESQRYIDSIAEADRLKLTVVASNNSSSDNTKKTVKKVKTSKSTTTIYKNNKPVATSNSNVNFDKVVTSNPSSNNTTTSGNAGLSGNSSQDAAIEQALKDEKDKEIAKEVKKEKKIETLNTVAKAPIYPGCEKKSTERAKKTCMISKINKFVNKNFNAYVAQDLGLNSGRQKIFVSFIIDKNGYVNILRTRAKHEALKKEAVRVVNKLPRMKPAIDKSGKKTQLVYNLPIVFSIEE